MRLTPLDIQNHQFSRRTRGYDRGEVDAFLEMISGDYESLLREAESLRERVRMLENRVERLSSNEKTLQETLITAQALSEDLKKTALKESELLISEAEVKAEKVLDAAHRRVAKLSEDIREMKALRARVGTAVRTTIETHLALLESLATEEPDDPALDGRVAYLTKTRRAANAGELDED
jgi:cell division initiation protein